MNKQERLALYEVALKDWLMPILESTIQSNHTASGFCSYFLYTHGINVYEDDGVPSIFEDELPELYQQRETATSRGYHYAGYGSGVEGRAKRVEALKKAIALCKEGVDL